MSTIRISDHDFTIADRYAEGHTLTANEAAALNQTLRENIGNNHRKAIKELIDAGTFDRDAYQRTLDTAVTEYEFGVRRTAVRTPTDPVEAEAQRLAVEAVKANIRKAGLTNVAKEAIAAKVEEVLADETKGAKLRATAKSNLKALASIGDLDADTPTLAAGLESGPKRARKTKGAPEAAAA